MNSLHPDPATNDWILRQEFLQTSSLVFDVCEDIKDLLPDTCLINSLTGHVSDPLMS